METQRIAFVLASLSVLICCGGGQTDGATTPQPDAQPATDETAEAPPPEEDAPVAEACSMIGTWQGTLPGGPLAGQVMTWSIVDSGVSQGSFGVAQVESTVTVEGLQLSIFDHSSTPPQVACPEEQVGRYDLAFGDDCNTVTVTAVEDLCEGRHGSVHAVSLTRQ